MTTRIFRLIKISAIISAFLIPTASVSAQVTSNASGLRNVPTDVEKANARVAQITGDAGTYFKQGLLNLQDQHGSQARDDFDKAVEVFLLSGINVKNNQKLQKCYSEMVETIYRLEIPSEKSAPQLRTLSTTCGWGIDTELLDGVAKMIQPKSPDSVVSPTTGNDALVASVMENSEGKNDTPQIGFVEQKFEPAIGDILSQIELQQGTEAVTEQSEVYQLQAQAIQPAIQRNSLGFIFRYHPLVAGFMNYYQGRGRSTMEIGLARSGQFTRLARRIFREEGVPENIVWLSQIESAWKVWAQSQVGASGLWQFMPGTGVRFGLRQNSYVDERNSLEKATRASAQYLKFLANRYNGNWELAMAAYNCGEGNVDNAIRRAGANDFWIAYPYLPRETRNYVPNILAAILIANNPQTYGFGHIRPMPPITYDQVRMPPLTSLGLIADAAGVNVEYLRFLNPELRQNITPNEPYIIRVPPTTANKVVASIKRIPAGQRNAANITTVAAGENIQNIANRTGASVDEIRAANAGVSIQRGTQIIVPKGNRVKGTVYQQPARTSTPSPQVAGGPALVRAKQGDTVASVAQRYGASAIEVAKLNGLFPDSKLEAGREIKIPR